MRTMQGIAGAAMLALALTACGSAAQPLPQAPSSSSDTSTSQEAAPKATKPAAPKLTTAQENAKRSAQSYLEMSGFSLTGLIKQLNFEGFSTKDAKAAIATIKVNWNREAAQSAKAYIEMSGFSRSGLIKQLEFEGFTAKQAAYGADSVGL